MTEAEHFALPMILGFALDALLGDPYRMPHPIRWFGAMIVWTEQKLNRGRNRRTKGVWAAVTLIGSVALLFGVAEWTLSGSDAARCAFNTLFFFFGVSNRSLIDEVWKVEKQVRLGSIDRARKQLSCIVGRQTDRLSFSQIRTASLETLSENLSDGVVAPMFFYLLGGIPAMMAYKMVNTLDSMIGYKSERYRDFGRFSAKADDVLNYIPARITAFFMLLVSFRLDRLAFVGRFGRCHASPNSGYPEAALAGVLNCRFGGPNYYHGMLVEKPYIGNMDRLLSEKDICTAVRINVLTSVAVLLLLLGIGLFCK